MTPLKWFYSFLRKYRARLCLGLFLTTCIPRIGGPPIVNPYLSGIIVDDVVLAGNYDLLPGLIVSLLGVRLLQMPLEEALRL